MKLFKSIILSIFIILLLSSFCFAGSKFITLGWTYTNVSDLGGFKIYQSSTSGNYDFSKPVANITDINARQYSFPTAFVDGNYFWVMTAYDKSGNESKPSVELSYNLDATPPPVPGTLVIISVSINAPTN